MYYLASEGLKRLVVVELAVVLRVTFCYEYNLLFCSRAHCPLRIQLCCHSHRVCFD